MAWLASQNVILPNYTKEDVNEALKNPDLSESVKRFLEIKNELGRTPIKKFDFVKEAVCSDQTIKGNFNMKRLLLFVFSGLVIISQQACHSRLLQQKNEKVKLLTLEPGHFHAALVQKSMYPQVDSTVHVYSSVDGPELKAHLALVNKYNTRPDAPTAWNEKIYTGTDFIDRMLDEK